ncbi:MFS transporter [Thioalkalivibrio sp. ALJ2]|uniref:MFS transporter n=1 Tax=Thioalkalivibrio sp. ALJ2 TaxID=1261622 RepID=UPI000368AEDA|nr:MFS transporter [Thioalkalivibrio sp. ALJ2]
MTLRPRQHQDALSLDSPTAWLACGLSLVALFVAFGIAYSYGAFFSSMAQEFGTRHGGSALFFSATALLFFGLSGVTGPLSDRIGPGPLLVAGGLFIAAGLVGTARAGELWQAYLAYGLGVGIGASCVFVPVVAAVGRWFARRRSMALGIAVSGIGLGVLGFAPLSAWLIELHGWRSTYYFYALAAAVILPLAGILFPRPGRAPDGTHATTTRWGGRRFAQLYLATFLLNTILYVPFVHLPPAAEAGGIDPLRAAGLVGIIGLASVVGRLAIGMLGDRYSLMHLYRGCFALITLSFLIWGTAGSYAALMLFAVVLGFGYGGYIALTPAILARLFGLYSLGRLLGMTYTAVALGAALGPVLTGLGVDLTGGYLMILIALHLVGLLAVLATLPIRDEPVTGTTHPQRDSDP